MQTTAGSLALVGAIPAADAFVVEAPARRGRGDPRQDEPLRVGQLPLDALLERLERPRRAVPQSLRARPQPVRLELRLGRRGGGEPLRASRSAPRPTARSSRRRTTAGSSGIKPTLGLVSRTGIIPIAHSQDTAGPMTPHRDRRRDPADRARRRRPRRLRRPRALAGKAPVDYTKFLDPKGLAGMRIGVPRKKLFGQSPAADAARRGRARRA